MTRFSRWLISACPRCDEEIPGGGAIVSADGALCAACWAAPPPGELVDHASLYGYQREGVARLASSPAFLLADEPGLGKTAQSLAAVDGPAIVVCPPSVRRQWCREVGRWAPRHRYRLAEGRQTWLPPRGLEVVVLGYTSLRGGPRMGGEIEEGTVLILDEAQSVKNPQAQQTQGVRGLSGRVRAASGRVWLLTATPAYASPREAWEVLRAADLHRALHPIGTRWEDMDPPEQARRLGRVMLRRRTRDVVDLPPLRWERQTVELPTKVAKDLDREARLVVARARHADDEEAVDEETLAAEAARLSAAEVRDALEQLLEADGDMPLATVRRLLSVAKLPRIEELAVEHEESQTPIVVLADHRAPLEALAGREGWGSVLGGQAARRRDEIVQAFRRGELIGMAVGYAAGGTGLDGLQERASRAVLAELPWTPAVLEQALGRLVRIGQAGASVLVTSLVADHWIDEMVTNKIESKIATLDELGIGLSMAGGAVS